MRAVATTGMKTMRASVFHFEMRCHDDSVMMVMSDLVASCFKFPPSLLKVSGIKK